MTIVKIIMKSSKQTAKINYDNFLKIPLYISKKLVNSRGTVKRLGAVKVLI